MDSKPKLFIYDRKEMLVLSLLGVFVALFAFTLGIHLGKRLVPPATSTGAPLHDASGVADATPNRQELAEKAKEVGGEVEDALDRTLHEEVVKSGIKLDQPRQVQLPRNAKSKNAGATSPSRAQQALKEVAAGESAEAPQNFMIQVGSYQALDEAKERIHFMETKGLKPQLKIADIRGRGVWYRVYLMGFASKDAAEKAGARYKAEKMIESFVVTKH